MRSFAWVSLALAGCFANHEVAVDQPSIEVPRGASEDVLVSIDGIPVEDLGDVLWTVDDPRVASVTPAYDGRHVRIGGDAEGETLVHLHAHGVSIDIPTRVGPPAVVKMWIEPNVIATSVGGEVPVKAFALDTMFRIQEVTHESRWSVRDTGVASLEMAGMMLVAEGEGRTTLHASNGDHATVVPIAIFK